MGVPSAMIDNPFFIRMIPIRVEDYVISIVTSILLGLVLGTFAISSVKGDGDKALGSGILTYLAVGCPICNKLVILFLGISLIPAEDCARRRGKILPFYRGLTILNRWSGQTVRSPGQ